MVCDSSIVVLQHGPDGSLLNVGRKTRTIPAAIRRALAARDRGCRFPGCTARRCDGHHITYWADGGPTRLENLLLLCRRHHRAVHEGGFHVERSEDGTIVFFRPDGVRLDAAPSPSLRRGHDGPVLSRVDHPTLTAMTIDPSTLPVWSGEPLDVVWALDVLRAREMETDPRDT